MLSPYVQLDNNSTLQFWQTIALLTLKLDLLMTYHSTPKILTKISYKYKNWESLQYSVKYGKFWNCIFVEMEISGKMTAILDLVGH